jgi:hypothetical protein
MSRTYTQKEIEFASGLTQREFFGGGLPEKGYADLLAHVDHQVLMSAVTAYLTLNYTAEQLRAAVTTPGGYRKILALSVITLLNRNAVPLLSPLGEAAERDMDKLRKETAIDVDLVAVPPPPPLSASALLEAEVRKDWKVLGMDGIRKKRAASRQYGITLDRLANDGTLESSVTSLRIAQ